MRRLIVNADDFGLTGGVNRAIAELHSRGVLTSATIMARAPATRDAIRVTHEMPTLGVGCHVVLVDGEPMLPQSDLPTLVDQGTGQFHATLVGFLRRLLTGGIRPEEIERETAAQIGHLQSRGLFLTHVDTHKHTHMFPSVLRPVLRAARAAGIRTVRNPFEPAWSRRATARAPLSRRIEVSLLHRLKAKFRRIVDEEGFITTDGAIGVLATGTLDRPGLCALLKEVPPGTWELVTHPGYHDAELGKARTRLTGSREIERSALSAVGGLPELKLIGFTQLTRDPAPDTASKR